MTPQDQEHKLTKKQQTFVASYLSNGFNATRAAIEAGYSRKSAYSIGSENLRKPEIAAAIAEGFEERGITPALCKVILGEVACDTDMADFEPWLQGKKTLAQLRAKGVNTSLVKAARITETGTRSIELHDRLAAVRELNRVLGIVVKNREARDSVEAASDYRDMSDEQLGREAHAIAPEPWVLPYLTQEELREWEARFETEKLRRKDGRPPKAWPCPPK